MFAKAASEIWANYNINILKDDFTNLMPDGTYNFVICNLPYVRHHLIESDRKIRIREKTEQVLGVKLSGLAGLYCHFLLQPIQWMADGGVAVWLIQGSKFEARVIMVKFTNVTKNFSKVNALDDISFEISKDKISGVIGHNGAGKTTLFMIANGLAKPSSGEVLINNYSLKHERNKIQEITGLFTDRLHLYRVLTVKEYLKSFLQINGRSPEIYKRYVDEFQLSEFLNKRIPELSTGMLKKLQLALSMANKPQVLFLDEPFSGLDPEARLEISKLIKDVKENEDIQILISSHDLFDLELIIDHLLILKKGKLIADGSLQDLMSLYYKKDEIIVETLLNSELNAQNIWQKLKVQSGKDFAKPNHYGTNLYRFKLTLNTYDVLKDNLMENERILAMYDYKPSLDDLYFKIAK